MKVFEITLQVYLLTDITFAETNTKIAELIDSSLSSDTKLMELHNTNTFKNYCFNFFYPLERSGIYKGGSIYSVQLRTVDEYLARFFQEKVQHSYTSSIKVLTAKSKILPKRPLEKIYSVTPLIIKTADGYWRGKVGLEFFERSLKENLIKKYNKLTNSKINEDFLLYTGIEFNNEKPVSFHYKGRKLLGDKVTMHLAQDSIVQELAFMSLGVGVLEMNARGAGFMGYRWL